MKRKFDYLLLVKVLLNKLKRVFIKNPVDKTYETIIFPIVNEYKKLENKNLKLLFGFFLKSIFDLASFHYSYINTILPIIKKNNDKFVRYFNKSFYSEQLNIIKKSDEHVFEMVRIGYVHLFHKYESFRGDMIKQIDENMSVCFKTNVQIRNYLMDTYKYDINDLKTQPARLRKINWICNCVKHKDGFPTKSNPPKEFENCDKSERIQIEIKEFEADILFLIEHFSNSISTFIHIAITQYAIGILEKDKNKNDEKVLGIKEKKKQIKIQEFISLFKLMDFENELKAKYESQ